MSTSAWVLLFSFIGYPIWMMYRSITQNRIDRIVVPVTRRKVRGPKPPPDHLPVPLVGNTIERNIARRILP